MSPSSSRRRRIQALAAVVAAALVMGTAGVATADQQPSPQPHAQLAPKVASGSGSGSDTGSTPPRAQLTGKGATLRYGVPVANCGDATPGHVSCFSQRIEPASKTTPGAVGYAVPKAATAGPAGGYTPANLASAYGFDPTSAAGSTQTVAIVDAFDDPNVAADLDAFDAEYGLPAETPTSFRKVNQGGLAAPLPDEDDGWSGEIALDVEAVRGVCNRCNIVLLEADSTGNADVDQAVNTAAAMGATEISNSYGGAEADTDGTSMSTSADLAAYDHPGIVITAASGDDGWYDWDGVNEGYASNSVPEAPASYPTVVAVGGTALRINADGSHAAETVWNENGRDDQDGVEEGGSLGASGGGCSVLYAAPSFQASVAGYSALGCGAKRATNDVAALADPMTGFDVYDSINNDSTATGHWATVGGTSLASPVIAAMWALAGGAGGVAYPARNLYDQLKRTPSSLFDVTQGGNSFCGGDTASSCSAYLRTVTRPSTGNPNGIGAGLIDCDFTASGTVVANNKQCNAGKGYDGPSGVGTPHGLAAFRPVPPTMSAVWPSLIKPGATETFRASGFTDPVMSPKATYTWTWGDGTTTRSTSTAATHRYARAGTYTVSVRVADQLGHISTAVSKRYVVGKAPSVQVKGPKKVHKSKRGTFTSTASDPNTGGRITSYTWRIGAKVVGHATTLKHRFPRKGKFKVRLTVADNSGLSATSRTLKVKVR